MAKVKINPTKFADSDFWNKIQQNYPGVNVDEAIDILTKNPILPGNQGAFTSALEGLSKKKNQEQLHQNIQEVSNPQKIAENYQEIEKAVNPLVEAEQTRLGLEREKYRQEAERDVTTELPGLTPQQRRSMQQGANTQINKQVQNYKRMIASSTGRRGIRGGAATAPQLEVTRQGLDAQNQFQRDLVERDTDLSMRRLAAYLASIEGRSAQNILSRGQYFDYLTGRQQQGQQAAYNKYFENLFSGMRK